MVRQVFERDNILKRIFRDGWDAFLERHPRFVEVDSVVKKMLGCGNSENGYASYICEDCSEKIVIPFSRPRLFVCPAPKVIV